jgi:hypothetical protein
MQLLHKSGEATFVVSQSVDKDQHGRRPQTVRKYGITEVPTIIVDNQKLVGMQAFVWLQKRIEVSQESPQQFHSRQNKQPVNIKDISTVGAGAQAAPTAFIPMDNFGSGLGSNCLDVSAGDNGVVLVDDNDEDKMQALRGNLILHDDNITANTINTPVERQDSDPHRGPQSISTNKDKLKSKQMDNAYNKMLAERDLGIQQPIRRM